MKMWDNNKRQSVVLKKEITSKRSLAIMASLFCLCPVPVLANPSQAFKEKSDCLENPTFLTPDSQEFKYCLQPDGKYKTINQEGSYLKKKFEIDKPFEEREVNGLRTITHSIEYKIEENELVQYKCKAKKSGGKYVCKESGDRVIKGVRPNGYFLKEGLKKIEDEKWKDAVEKFTSEIELSNDKDAYYPRAFANLMIKDYLGAIKDSSTSLRLNKEDIKAYNVRSFSRYKIDDHKGAVNDLNKLIKLVDQSTDKEIEEFDLKEIEELDMKEINELYDKFYFRRALSNSELGNQKAAIKDFDKALERDPLNGQAYFQRGLENYWSDRNLACRDMLKGLSLGAEDRSELLINNSTQETSFLEELFEKENTLMSSCKGVSQEKVDNNKSKYQREKLMNEGGDLFRRYLLVIPIFLIVIVTIVLKYTNNDE